MSNAEPIVIRAACKPPPSLENPLESVDLKTLQPAPAARQRSDVCFAPAASCVLENAVAFEIARAVIERFGGDSLAEIQARRRLHLEMVRAAKVAGEEQTQLGDNDAFWKQISARRNEPTIDRETLEEKLRE